jgi:hypothetical protein
MGKLKVVLFLAVTLSICLSINKAKAQSALLGEGEKGILAEAGIGFTEGFSGPVFGLGYSFNGMTGLGISYGVLSADGKNIQTISAGINGFILKEDAGDAANIELSAGFQRGTGSLENSDQNLFALTGSVSKDFNNEQGFSFIPRAGFTYGITTANRQGFQNGNSIGSTTAISLDTVFGIPLAKNFILKINPGFSLLLKESISSGFVSSGILIH